MATLKNAYLDASPGQRNAVLHSLSAVLSALRASYLFYQTCHWQAKGDPFYGDHLLFERLYKSVEEEVDTLAEKMVGYFGGSSVDLNAQMRQMTVLSRRWSEGSDPFSGGLKLEQDVQRLLQTAYDRIKATGAMTLGLDDFLMSTASSHEGNLYLLQQRCAR